MGSFNLWTKNPFFTFQLLEYISDACSAIKMNIKFEIIHSTSSQWYGNTKASRCYFSINNYTLSLELNLKAQDVVRIFLRRNFNHSGQFNLVLHLKHLFLNCLPFWLFSTILSESTEHRMKDHVSQVKNLANWLNVRVISNTLLSNTAENTTKL